MVPVLNILSSDFSNPIFVLRDVVSHAFSNLFCKNKAVPLSLRGLVVLKENPHGA